MKRGEVWEADLDGKAGIRPVVLLTRSAVIPHLNKVTVAEITSQGKGYPTEVDINQQANLPRHSFVQLDNIQTIPKQRLTKYIGTLNDASLQLIGQKVVLALNLEDVFSLP
ncbi:MAG TPA: type II toxin-antitoxin system PemK/MazF family toxin [Blastocatellia bacterium]|nr:type II toxin-antitoxin system PemK/MazF family toxin [Blastocatellia bacterium]HMX27267.1 type II toxin-antitoxin system PemK/MazF family toxin [Blastocatellia bacterium]HMY76329.1 type II toxin-antitoxin system PemK/MazF family toxin [Blastocatellia bacterium]HMZ16978.1 type II toxin-antitoxin system PemK/MazF family toxin [Blastocatellia bacterium]HNG30394.1 type II toxin-antitoxin system PemK/MazF family toxin [Blastocatellia bacterium]